MADKEPGHNTCCSEHTTGIMTKTLAEHNGYGINEGDTRSIPSFFFFSSYPENPRLLPSSAFYSIYLSSQYWKKKKAHLRTHTTCT